jgi:hypothetical protein
VAFALFEYRRQLQHRCWRGALAINNGTSNTAVGAAALLLNTTGTENTAVGTDALVFNDSGGFNSAVGAFAFFNNTEGSVNIAVGATHCLQTPLATPIRPSVFLRSKTISPGLKTRPSVAQRW